MKVPGNGSENRCEVKKCYHRTNSSSEGKTSEEKKELSGMKGEEGDVSSCGIEPSATALIPPWLRNTFGLAEKDTKPNQKCWKIYCATNDRQLCSEKCETKADSNGDCLKCHFYIQDSPSKNPILEVNIGSEADFLNDSAEKLSSQWKSKSIRHNQYDCNLYGISKERELSKPAKSEVTSIDVVVPTEEVDEDKTKMRSHKGKWRMRRTSNGYFTSEDNLKSDADTVFRSAERDLMDEFLKVEPFPVARNLDGRLLLLCGKRTFDNLTQEDVALLQEMKNQIGHKEGLEKLFNEIRESALTEKEARKVDRKEESECKREDSTTYFFCKNEECRSMAKNRVIDADGKKYRNQQRHVRYNYEPEVEKDKKSEKWKAFGPRARSTYAEKERKTKLRHSDYSVVEKVVTETLQKFIDMYQVQVPQNVVNVMKKKIIQNVQNEYQETNGSRRGLDAVLAVQDQFNSPGVIKCTMDHLLMEDQQSGYKAGDAGVTPLCFTSEENVVSKDIPPGETPPKSRLEIGKAETLKLLRKDFETCLELIQHQLDVTGARLCSAVLEKNGTEDKKMRIVHNFSNGMTESVKIYDRSIMGSPEGDSVHTTACDCQFSFRTTKRSQWSQTKEISYEKVSTQTDWVDVSVKHFRNADLTPGLYRITKATESGRFYLTPEALDDNDLDADTKLKRVSSEMCVRSSNEPFKNELLKYVSRETFTSERWDYVGESRKLWRSFRSDCLGLNKLTISFMTKTPGENIIKDFRKPNERQVKETVKIEVQNGLDESRDFVTETNNGEAKGGVNPSVLEGYHRECVWLWNGEKISPGIDLKIHVENLLHEKLNEMLCDSKVTELKAESTGNPVGEGSAKNLEIRKTEGKFCIPNENSPTSMSSPFVFRAFNPKSENSKIEAPIAEELKTGKLVREVGTQNSQHRIVSLSIGKVKPRSKLCTFAKFSKRRQSNSQRLRRANSKYTETSSPFAESVGEAKKVKLEFREDGEYGSKRDRGSEGNSDSVRECFSIVSNDRLSSVDKPVRVKLIGIEVSKDKSPGDGDSCSAKSLETKDFVVEGYPMMKEDEKERKFKHWEIIENVLNRVSQKEKDFLWNDIRDFVKKKIGRDINDEGAREVCIEIEQDVSKFAKGKASRMVVARGNYTRNEGDVEVEVDLTLDDLEKILRHRQKMRRRMHTSSQKTESKESSTTSSDTVTDYRSFKCRPFLGEDYITNSEVKMLKEHN